MRFATLRSSPEKSLNPRQNASPSKPNRRQQQVQNLFLHYNNAIYMGGIVSYKRSGNGILLLDDGTSLISQYCFDTMTGHNIIFRENSIISILFLKNNMYEIVIRSGCFIAKLPFYQKENVPNGSGLLIDYQKMKIFHILFEGGKIKKKIVESNKKIIDKIMNQELNVLMDQRHQNALKLKIKYENGIKILKDGKRITIGYVDNRHYLQGIGFKIKVNQNSYDDFLTPLELKFIQRGFYIRNRLQNYGERYFSNGNVYIGEFQDDLFNGQGLLLYPHQQKWVYGVFQNDKLTKMININLPQNDNRKPQTVKSCLRSIHQFNNCKNWICNDIDILQWQILKNKFNQMINSKITDITIEKQRIQRQQQDRLIRIQEHFSSEEQSQKIDKVMKEQINRNILSQQKIIINQYSSLKSKVLQIEPRNAENQDYWSNSLFSKIQKLNPKMRNNPLMKFNTSKYQTESAKTISPSNRRQNKHSPTKRFNYRMNV